jgi:hypothetical protein
MARKWTEEEKQAFGANMKRLREEKLAKEMEEEIEALGTELDEESEQENVLVPKAQLDELLKRIAAVEKDKDNLSGAPAQGVGVYGNPVGLITKYPTNPGLYPDPRPQLMEEPKLQRFGFKDNFVLSWEIKSDFEYETKWGTHFTEPRFKLTLYQRILDDYGDPVLSEDGTPKLKIIQTHYLFEDSLSVDRMAQDINITLTGKELYDYVRYERIKDWLFGIFLRPKIAKSQLSPVETVMDGQVVQVVSLGAIGGDPNFQTKIVEF